MGAKFSNGAKIKINLSMNAQLIYKDKVYTAHFYISDIEHFRRFK